MSFFKHSKAARGIKPARCGGIWHHQASNVARRVAWQAGKRSVSVAANNHAYQQRSGGGISRRHHRAARGSSVTGDIMAACIKTKRRLVQ